MANFLREEFVCVLVQSVLKKNEWVEKEWWAVMDSCPPPAIPKHNTSCRCQLKPGLSESVLRHQSDRAVLGWSPAECLHSGCPSVQCLKPALNLAVVTHGHRAAQAPQVILTSHLPGVNASLPLCPLLFLEKCGPESCSVFNKLAGPVPGIQGWKSWQASQPTVNMILSQFMVSKAEILTRTHTHALSKWANAQLLLWEWQSWFSHSEQRGTVSRAWRKSWLSITHSLTQGFSIFPLLLFRIWGFCLRWRVWHCLKESGYVYSNVGSEQELHQFMRSHEPHKRGKAWSVLCVSGKKGGRGDCISNQDFINKNETDESCYHYKL